MKSLIGTILSTLIVVLITSTAGRYDPDKSFKYYSHDGNSSPYVKKIFSTKKYYVINNNIDYETFVDYALPLFLDSAFYKIDTIIEGDDRITIYKWQTFEYGDGYFAINKETANKLYNKYKTNKWIMEKL